MHDDNDYHDDIDWEEDERRAEWAYDRAVEAEERRCRAPRCRCLTPCSVMSRHWDEDEDE